MKDGTHHILGILLLSVLSIAGSLPLEARTHEFRKYGCCITVPDSGWVVQAATVPENVPAGTYTELVNVSKNQGGLQLGVSVVQPPQEFSEQSYGEKWLEGLEQGFTQKNSVVLDKKLITFNGSKAARVVVQFSGTEGGQIRVHVIVIPTRWYTYNIVLKSAVDDPEQNPELRPILESFQLCGMPEVPKGSTSTTTTPRDSDPGSTAFELGRTVGRLILPVGVIVAIIIGIRRYRRKKAQEQ